MSEVRVNLVRSDEFGRPLPSIIVQLSRVPCVGEFIAVPEPPVKRTHRVSAVVHAVTPEPLLSPEENYPVEVSVVHAVRLENDRAAVRLSALTEKDKWYV